MGSCQGTKEVAVNHYQKSSKQKLHSDDLALQLAEFPNMPEWPGERYSGIGIKKMKGYIYTLPIDKLNEERAIFWRTRKNHNNDNYKIWRLIHQACVYDVYRANFLLQEYQLTTADGCINHIIDPNGNHYHIPNYCINDPYFEKNLDIEDEDEERTIEVVLYEMNENPTVKVHISTHASGEELKKAFRKESKVSKKEFALRLFFAGNEIKNEHLLYQHKLRNRYKIQVMKVPKEKDEKKEERKEKKRGTKKKETNKSDITINEENLIEEIEDEGDVETY